MFLPINKTLLEVLIMTSNEKKHYTIEDPNHVGEVIISWIITHSCQERCGYCISPNKRSEITTR